MGSAKYKKAGYFPENPVSSPQPAQNTNAKKPAVSLFARFPALRFVLLGVCILVFAYCAFRLTAYIVQNIQAREANQAFTSTAMEETSQVQITPTPAPSPASTENPEPTQAPAVQASPEVQSNAEELWPTEYAGNKALRISAIYDEQLRKNSDFVGQLTIDGVLDAPVFQRDNTYYLTHNALGRTNNAGALFLDEDCDLKTVPTQYIIHGHNMKDGTNFGILKKYKVKDASYYRAHPYITFNTLYETGKYVIFAVCEVDTRFDQDDYLPFWCYSRFASSEEFTEYIRKAKSLSHYQCGIDVVPGDRLLTLATCLGTDDNKRLLVMARKVRDGEDEFSLSLSILSTGDK